MRRALTLFTLIFVLVSFAACGDRVAQNSTEPKGKEPNAENFDLGSRKKGAGGSGTGVRKTADEAKGIAFTHAGVTEVEVYDLEVVLDKENGREIYEVDFEKDGTEYEYVIDAYTGEILKKEKSMD